MKTEIINAVAQAGFEVWMRNPSDTWLLFTDGKHIGYLQDDRLRGICLSTVHIPNKTTGTGFRVAEFVSDLTRDQLAAAFAHAPAWAVGREVASVKKYRDIEHYRSTCDWNAAYRKVNEEKTQ